MALVEIAPPAFDVETRIVYATAENFTGRAVYRRAGCYLHADAAALLSGAIVLAAELGLRLKVYDAFRPSEAQWLLWEHTPDPDFLADPRRGSPHSRGVAVDVTLVAGAPVDGTLVDSTLVDSTGRELDMGSPVDGAGALAVHGCTDIPATAQRNRAILLGLMAAAGWDHYRNEWWHYQMFEPRRYPVLTDAAAGTAMM